MGFIQIIEFRTSKIEEIRKVGEEWESKRADDSPARRRFLCEDRDNEGRYVNIVLFDSYESAMENSNHPTTQEFSQKMMALADGPPTFTNLEVLEERP
ncbi:MAG: hypothetical protein WKF43_05555 [Acidimicrobiales bacterium]